MVGCCIKVNFVQIILAYVSYRPSNLSTFEHLLNMYPYIWIFKDDRHRDQGGASETRPSSTSRRSTADHGPKRQPKISSMGSASLGCNTLVTNFSNRTEKRVNQHVSVPTCESKQFSTSPKGNGGDGTPRRQQQRTSTSPVFRASDGDDAVNGRRDIVVCEEKGTSAEVHEEVRTPGVESNVLTAGLTVPGNLQHGRVEQE